MVGELLSRLRAANSFTTARIAIKRGKQIRGKRGRRNFRSQRGEEGGGGEGRGELRPCPQLATEWESFLMPRRGN